MQETLVVKIKPSASGNGYILRIFRNKMDEVHMEWCSTRFGARRAARRWAKNWAKGKYGGQEVFAIDVNRKW